MADQPPPPPVSDYRALPDATMNMYLYPIAAWGMCLGGLFFFQQAAVAIWLCYPLAIWQILLTTYWGITTWRRVNAGDLSRAEADAGVRSVGNILAASSLMPGIVFMAADPLAESSWGALAGVFFIAAIVYFGSAILTKGRFRFTRVFNILLGLAALPVNATGAMSVAAMIGWYDQFYPGLKDLVNGMLG